ncbi:MAG TPA: aspartate/glutamate racemase family protein [Ilumatobacter sp.]|nr:aspartate/glutamate racemase family protein [Ilumatobacter sp.]
MQAPALIALIGPTSAPWEEVAPEVEPDLARLARRGVELRYVLTGAGPRSITSDEEERAAAPHVVDAVVRCELAGFDAAIVDCTADPGLDEARRMVRMPVLGAGESLRRAIDASPLPVTVLSGDLLRSRNTDALIEYVAGARVVALGGTGWSHLVPVLAGDERAVLDPLDVALAECLALLDRDQEG